MPVDNVRGSSTVSQPIIVQSVLIYSIIIGDIIICEIKVLPMLRRIEGNPTLPMLRRIEGNPTGCDIARHLDHNSWELWVAIHGICLLISGTFAWISLPFALVLLWLVFVPAVLSFMVELSAVGARVFIPLVAVICSVLSRLAMFAIQFLGLFVRLLLVVVTALCFYYSLPWYCKPN